MLQQYEPAMLKIVKIALERNTEISACCCQEALARMRTCLLTRYGAPGVGYGIYLVSNYPMKIQESTWWYDKGIYFAYFDCLVLQVTCSCRIQPKAVHSCYTGVKSCIQTVLEITHAHMHVCMQLCFRAPKILLLTCTRACSNFQSSVILVFFKNS